MQDKFRSGVELAFVGETTVEEGMQAAKAAGIHAVAVPNGVTQGWPFDHADRVIGSLHGITVQAVGGWLGACAAERSEAKC